MKDIATMLAAITIIGIIGAGWLSYDQWKCRQTASVMGLPSYWSFGTRCMVQDKGRWYPLERVWSNGVAQ